MKKIILVFIFSIQSLLLFSQNGDSTSLTIRLTHSRKQAFVQLSDRPSHRYPTASYEHQGVQLIRNKGNIVRYDSLDDLGHLIFSVACVPEVITRYITFVADSIPRNKVNPDILGKDSILPREIIVYSLELMRQGTYLEFYSNGNLKLKGKYSKNLKNGKWRHYNIDGRLTRVERFEYGLLIKSKLKDRK